MNIDGVVREISGDQETVKVVARDKGDLSDTYQGNDKGGDTAGGNSNLHEKIVIDPKRKRIETESQDANGGINIRQIDGPQNVTGPKNLDMAGSGFQACQTL